MGAVEGALLNITRVRREHMGNYVCFANNGIPPAAFHRISLEVTCKYSTYTLHCAIIIAVCVGIVLSRYLHCLALLYTANLVAPTIKLPNQMVGSNNGSFALLECYVEAFPPALTYWVFGESKMIENNWKYKMKVEDQSLYTSHLVLNITYIEPADYAMYKFVIFLLIHKSFLVFNVQL